MTGVSGFPQGEDELQFTCISAHSDVGVDWAVSNSLDLKKDVGVYNEYKHKEN